jgi:hypothetical protein
MLFAVWPTEEVWARRLRGSASRIFERGYIANTTTKLDKISAVQRSEFCSEYLFYSCLWIWLIWSNVASESGGRTRATSYPLLTY